MKFQFILLQNSREFFGISVSGWLHMININFLSSSFRRYAKKKFIDQEAELSGSDFESDEDYDAEEEADELLVDKEVEGLFGDHGRTPRTGQRDLHVCLHQSPTCVESTNEILMIRESIGRFQNRSLFVLRRKTMQIEIM